jgi:hypothetical protein
VPSYTVDLWSLAAGVGLGILLVFALVAIFRTITGRDQQ